MIVDRNYEALTRVRFSKAFEIRPAADLLNLDIDYIDAVFALIIGKNVDFLAVNNIFKLVTLSMRRQV